MSTKPQSPGPNAASAASTKPRSRKAATSDQAAGRAGSAGGVVLEKESAKKPSTVENTASKDAPPKRKPRKLNKEPTSTPAETPKTLTSEAAELEALKSRVRGLEAKVEELYKSTPATTPRSPRRRGKGRKNSSATTTATLGTLAQRKDEQQGKVEELGDDDEADEELVRLESELETARQDLALYQPSSRPRQPRTRTTPSNDTDFVEEIPRQAPGVSAASSDRQVTLSGSYRIPLPATLNPEDVKTIQSGVSAAQNVARSFLDQRRANQAMKQAQAETGPPPSSSSSSSSTAAGGGKPKAKSKSKAEPAASTELSTQVQDAGRQSWGEWIGGYSMAISRAVKNIEHEAAMEAQNGNGNGNGRPAQSRRSSATKKKRPAAKPALSGEQIQGLMS